VPQKAVTHRAKSPKKKKKKREKQPIITPLETLLKHSITTPATYN
jgi:hypothetical protein